MSPSRTFILSVPVLFEQLVRPYCAGNFVSRLRSTVKQRWVWSVRGWVTACKHLMSLVVSSFFLASALFVLELLAVAIVASSAGFHLDAHLSFTQTFTLLLVRNARTSV